MLDINNIITNKRNFFESNITKNIDFRKEALEILLSTIIKYEDEILKSLNKDLSKSAFEAYETEFSMVVSELKYMIKNLKVISKPIKVKTSLSHFPSKSKIYKEPYGVTLIISPWNYPFQLTMMPLIGALAAGNCVIIKPSEYSTYTSKIIEKIIKEAFNSNYVSVILGDKNTSEEILNNKFDYIFFTGSVSVGRSIMKKAAENLTPVTLELGGKSPCVVDETANVDLAAKRIVWGKFLNAGQTCVAPDYILVHKSVKKDLVAGLKKYITEFYGPTPEKNSNYPKIINKNHFNRLYNLLLKERYTFGGNINSIDLKISPTIIEDATWISNIMNDEIFGPILPIIEFENIQDIITEINYREKPLALYLFTTSNKTEKLIVSSISFGGGCINDTIIHLANENLPFGGVGQSGIGSYHGKHSFDTFSHSKSILKKSNMIDLELRYPPFKSLKLLKIILKMV